MNPETLNQIKEALLPLADKLSLTGQFTFSLFVKQAYVNAFMGLFWLIPAFACLWLLRKLVKWDTEGDADCINAKAAGMIGFSILAFIIFYLVFSNLVGVLINPEYQAIKLILETIKQK